MRHERAAPGASRQTGAATDASRHATLRALERRIERLEHDHGVGDTPPQVGAAHAHAHVGVPC